MHRVGFFCRVRAQMSAHKKPHPLRPGAQRRSVCELIFFRICSLILERKTLIVMAGRSSDLSQPLFPCLLPMPVCSAQWNSHYGGLEECCTSMILRRITMTGLSGFAPVFPFNRREGEPTMAQSYNFYFKLQRGDESKERNGGWEPYLLQEL